jgi:hypothetical protein
LNKQKLILEIMLYVVLLLLGVIFYSSDPVNTSTKEDNIISKQNASKEVDTLDEVSQELIDYNFKFEGE